MLRMFVCLPNRCNTDCSFSSGRLRAAGLYWRRAKPEIIEVYQGFRMYLTGASNIAVRAHAT